MKTKILILLSVIITVYLSSCTKTEYRVVDDPAYIRVFNNLTYTLTLDNKEELQPFFCMFIDPEFDASGKPVGGLVVSDFLDKRGIYAAPNAAHAGLSTSKFNPEYPGKELVPTAPILNGFDLTNWAQLKAGKRRFVFMSRPISNVPFGKLPDEQQRKVFLDTVINLSTREVYTIHILQKNFKTKKNGLYVRQETFHKQPFSDTLSYVNFYNLSADGFLDAAPELKLPVPNTSSLFRYGIRDTMNIFLTHAHYVGVDYRGQPLHERIPNFSFKFAGTVFRTTHDPKVTHYYGFPVLLKSNKQVYSDAWQFFQFCAPPIDPATSMAYAEPPNVFVNSPIQALEGRYAHLQMNHDQYNPNNYLNAFFPGLTVNLHSGIYNPRTFGVVNSIEIVNGNVFLTTVQRKYPQPIY